MDLGRVYPVLSKRPILSIRMINGGDVPKKAVLECVLKKANAQAIR